MTVYTTSFISRHCGGGGMYQGGVPEVHPNVSYANHDELIHAMSDAFESFLPLDAALTDESFMAYEVEDIQGRIYNTPDDLYVGLAHGELSYLGISEAEVPDNFFDSHK